MAMVGFNENMEALKRNFLVRGFFNGRGYFDLDDISPAAYRQGALTKGGGVSRARVWLRSDALFEPDPGQPANERLTDAGRMRVDAAIGPFLKHVASGIVMVEGYAQQGPLDQQYLRSLERASLVRDYLLGKFHFDPETTGVMPLGADSGDSLGAAAVGWRRPGGDPSQGHDGAGQVGRRAHRSGVIGTTMATAPPSGAGGSAGVVGRSGVGAVPSTTGARMRRARYSRKTANDTVS